jgi:hypothetical protein
VVVATKQLTIRGDAEAVEAVDCFSPTRPIVDPTTQAIVAPPLGTPSGVSTVLFDLQADDIELRGFVLRGTGIGGDVSRAAVMTSPSHSGYAIHHNLIFDNTVATSFNSGPVTEPPSDIHPSRFHHNCLRENGWGVANDFRPLSDARVDHNTTFKTTNFVYEQTPTCVELLCTAIGMNGVTFDNNASKEDNQVFRLTFSTSTSVLENSVTSARIGARLAGGNQDLDIIGNDLHVLVAGVASVNGLPSNVRVLIQGNSITGTGMNAGIGMGSGALRDSWILENAVLGVNGEGIALNAGNTGNLVAGNIVEDSGNNGIRAAAGATGNTFEANQMHRNGRLVTSAVDARDDARAFNVWHGNACESDLPLGTICGVP